MDNHIFRSAINGFNRHDVMGYIEKTQKAAAERAAALEAQLGEAGAEVEQLRAALEQCTAERDALKTQLGELTDKDERTEAELNTYVEKTLALQSELVEARTERDALNNKLQAMEHEVAAAREEKERVAQLELEAHKRADALMEETRANAEMILAETRAEADEIRCKAQAQAEEKIRESYDRAEVVRTAMEERVRATDADVKELVASVETIAAHVASELRKMDVAVTQLPISFNRLKDGMRTVLEQAEDRSAAEQ